MTEQRGCGEIHQRTRIHPRLVVGSAHIRECDSPPLFAKGKNLRNDLPPVMHRR